MRVRGGRDASSSAGSGQESHSSPLSSLTYVYACGEYGERTWGDADVDFNAATVRGLLCRVQLACAIRAGKDGVFMEDHVLTFTRLVPVPEGHWNIIARTAGPRVGSAVVFARESHTRAVAPGADGLTVLNVHVHVARNAPLDGHRSGLQQSHQRNLLGWMQFACVSRVRDGCVYMFDDGAIAKPLPAHFFRLRARIARLLPD